MSDTTITLTLNEFRTLDNALVHEMRGLILRAAQIIMDDETSPFPAAENTADPFRTPSLEETIAPLYDEHLAADALRKKLHGYGAPLSRGGFDAAVRREADKLHEVAESRRNG